MVNGEMVDVWHLPVIGGSWAANAAYWAGADFASERWKQRLIDQYNPYRKYKPSQRGGYDALTGSTNPSARLQ
jgi:hypothetical protein